MDQFIRWKTYLTQSAIAMDILSMFSAALLYFASNDGQSMWSSFVSWAFVARFIQHAFFAIVFMSVVLWYSDNVNFEKPHVILGITLTIVVAMACVSIFPTTALVLLYRFGLWLDGERMGSTYNINFDWSSPHLGAMVVSTSKTKYQNDMWREKPVNLYFKFEMFNSNQPIDRAIHKVANTWLGVGIITHFVIPAMSGLITFAKCVIHRPERFTDGAWETSSLIVYSQLFFTVCVAVLFVMSHKASVDRYSVFMQRAGQLYEMAMQRKVKTIRMLIKRQPHQWNKIMHRLNLYRHYLTNLPTNVLSMQDKYMTRDEANELFRRYRVLVDERNKERHGDKGKDDDTKYDSLSVFRRRNVQSKPHGKW
eukprot:TRINITY_DN1456_c0_g1_i11.p1 TRINITY_DN1456_c0_g1~~TRINITY_DN1456_c0_g1_i11.p1  ORF type:complete len:366 (-),score=105.43 TRINITY_DN1456_c0_g1_i11:23-1120(-)